VSDGSPILIVDGNAHMVALLRRFLERHNTHVHVAMSVAEALNLLDQRLFRVVLTDIFLPHHDGLALLRQICRTTSHTRVILMVAFGSQELCKQALAEGAYACLRKPFSLQQLWGKVAQAIQQGEPCAASSRATDCPDPGGALSSDRGP
jgi:two-component system response regulator (stage 0 sporulation protein A)